MQLCMQIANLIKIKKIKKLEIPLMRSFGIP